ncbi:MAG: radical SAM protein [Deltaproteobacteria bacterium]|nr:radical SAM protein [Deltaproteobacteria bacterium]
MNEASPYTYLGLTVGICPTCHMALPASLLERDGKIYMGKSCPTHGRFKSLIASDAAWYHAAQSRRSPSLRLQAHQTQTTRGCPHDCGVCPEHEQNNSVPVIEITNVCNLDCPICFADNQHDYMMSVDEFEGCLDSLDRSGSDVDVLVLTGGEPTAHPKLVELVERAYRRPRVPRVAIATNGILLARREELVRRLAAANAYVLFQLDSTDPEKNRALRGKEMTEIRDRALALLEKHDVHTSILMTVIGGLNDDEIGALLDLTLSRPFIRGLEVQTMAYTGSGGRRVRFDPRTRITGTDLIQNIEAQSNGLVRRSDFLPMPHPHPNCAAITYLLALNDGTYLPFLRFTDLEVYRSAITSQFIAHPGDKHEELLGQVIDGVWANVDRVEKGPIVLETLKRLLGELYPCDRETSRADRIRTVQKYVKNVFLHNYMDDHSFDAAVLRKCTSMQILPDGRMIPNCGYRVLHRATDPRWQNRKSNPGHGVDGLRHGLAVLS